MRHEVAEAQKKFAETEKRRTEEEARKAAEEKSAREAEEKARKEAADKAVREKKEGYETRKAARRAESARRLEEARRAVEEDRRTELARQEAVTRKLKDARLSIRLKNRMQLDDVVVQGFTRDEIKLAFQFEGASVEQTLPVDFISDRSYVDLMRAIHKGEGAAGLYEMGRQLVLRKLWKDAHATFQECVKLDSSYAPRVPDVSRILNNEAAFKGSARRIGSDQLLLAWDFSDAEMAQDFRARQPGKMAVEEGELHLESKGTALWTLKDVEFERDVDVDLVAVLEENAALVLAGFLTWDRNGYLAVLNNRMPAGNFLFRMQPGKMPQAITGRPEPKIAPGAETRIRFQARSGSLAVYVGDKEIGRTSDVAHQKGWLALGVAGGKLRIKQMTVQGRVNPAEIDKRFAEVEVLVRRAFEADLGRKAKSDDEVDPLSAEDEYFLSALPAEAREAFEKTRAELVQAIQKRRITSAMVKALEDVIQKAPEFAAARFWRGVVHLAARRPDEAQDEFERALRLVPEFHEARQLLARSRLDEQDVAAAEAEVRKALELMPGEADTLALQGQIRYLRGDSKGALGDLEVARKIDPSSEYARRLQRNVQGVIKGPQHLGARFVKEFPHFTVMTDMSNEKTVLYGNRLEAAFRHYADTFKDFFAEDPKRPKPRVAIFNTREAYLTYGEMTLSGRQEWTLGYFHPLYNELLLFEDVDIDATLHTLYHEAFHQFMRTVVNRRVPYWYNEGMAEYMGGIRVEVPKAGAPKIAERARVLENRLKMMKMGLRAAMKFEAIMMQTPGQFYSGHVPLKYAQAWSMVHFFYEAADGKHRPRIESYFRKLMEGGTPREAFEAGFKDANLEALQKEWAEYVQKLELPKK